MAHDKRYPSGVNKSKSGTGIPNVISNDKMKQDDELTEKYTDDDNDIAGNVHQGHPNRNEDKGHATGIDGHRG